MINKIITESQKSRIFSLVIVDKSRDMHKYITEQIMPVIESLNVKHKYLKNDFSVKIDNNSKFESEITVINAEYFDVSRILGRYYSYILILDTCKLSDDELQRISFRKTDCGCIVTSKN